jgi:hypothetical protein
MRKPKINEKVYIKTIPQAMRGKGKPATVKAVVLDSVTVKLFHSETVDVHISDIDYIKAEKFSGKESEEIIIRLVKAETLCEPNQLILQRKFLNILIEKYPSLQFWKNFSPKYQVRSLIWWLAGGKMEMMKEYNKYTLDFPDPINHNELLLEESIGENYKIKPKKIKVFDL